MSLIQPIIVMVESQKDAVIRLVKHCEALDGTRVGIVRLPPEADRRYKLVYPHNEKACRAAFAMRCGALAMKGKPFIWLEHDSIPLKRGWVKSISDEYHKLGKPFMLSSDSYPPNDYVGGIGVYGPDTHWMLPDNYKKSSWDLWMLRNLGPLISKTPLIQHSYGIYPGNYSNAIDHRFPRDARMLRSDAVVFHKDAHQDLITPSNRFPQGDVRTFYHTGDLGDVVYHLEIIRRMGGGNLALGQEMGFKYPLKTREPMTPIRSVALISLAGAQPYIKKAYYAQGIPEGCVNLNEFRKHFQGDSSQRCTSLQRAGLITFGLPVQDETEPWLFVDEKVPELDGKIIVARSERYPRPGFPWGEIVAAYGRKMVFIGSPKEHLIFCDQFGSIPYFKTENLLEAARAIASADLFIGNQSCPYAIAEGLKAPAIQESWPHEPNCLFQRQNLLNMTADFTQIRRFIKQFIS